MTIISLLNLSVRIRKNFDGTLITAKLTDVHCGKSEKPNENTSTISASDLSLQENSTDNLKYVINNHVQCNVCNIHDSEVAVKPSLLATQISDLREYGII